MAYCFRLAKENFKFSCTHFTIFGPSSAEKLHGHNYKVMFEFTCDKLLPDLAMAFDFNEIKPTMKNICDQLDESILVPTQSPYVQLKQDDKQVELFFADKTYRFPREDVHLLPIINVTVEALAFYLHQEVQKSFKSKWGIRNFAVTIEETDGQSVTFDDDVQQKR